MADHKKTFLMIDGSSLLFRAFFAIRNLTTHDGIATNGVYGFLNMYLRACDVVHPDYIVVAFDRKGKTFRAEDYEAYKANRPETPSELNLQFGITKEILQRLGVRAVDEEGFEADDIVGTLSRVASREGIQSYLLTGDRDYFQLVDEQTTVLFTKKGISELEKVTPEWIQAHYGVSPKALIEVKGLQGDKSDNIPGIDGIGEKTALKLISTYGTLEEVFAHREEVSGKKLRERLEEGEAQAYLSRKLGTIYREVPMDTEMEHYRPTAIDAPSLAEHFERLEFHSLAERFSVAPAREELHEEAQWCEVNQWGSLASLLSKQAEIPWLLCRNGTGEPEEKPALCAFRTENGESWLLDLRGHSSEFQMAFSGLFHRPDVHFLCYDAKDAIVQLDRLGISFGASYQDLMLMEYLQDPNRFSYNLETLAERTLGLPLPGKEELFGKGRSKHCLLDTKEETLFSFVSGALHTMVESKPKMQKELERLEMTDLFLEIENPLALVLAHMEIAGFAVDIEVLNTLDGEFSKALSEEEEKVYQAAGEVFNINSPKQLGTILFEKLGLPHGKKTKTGYSTNAEVLEKLSGAHPVVDAVLAYRKLTKLKSTYVDGLRTHIASDGRIHSNFRQNVAATGRISSTDPNLQNIPVRTEEGRKLRAVFVAPSGKKLVDADYSQIELRILASMSGDETMIEAFKKGEDIHRKTAAEVNHIEPEQVTSLQRSYAKAVNFGIIYGISDYGLSRDLGISRKEAADYIASYKDTYPQIKAYMETVVSSAKREGYVETAYGRRREIPELQSKNYNVRGFGERIALNTPIQGTAADVIKLAMIRVDQKLQERGGEAKLILQIHDELIVEAPEEEAEEVGTIVKQTMEEIGDFAVPLTADMQMGNSWYETK